jgi:hypothetical protein
LGYIAKLIKGSRTLDLNSGPYKLGDDFIPPGSNEVPILSTGNSFNEYDGGELISSHGEDSGLAFRVKISGSSSQEVKWAHNDLLAFLRLAGDEREPLYLMWKPDSRIPIEPHYGQDARYTEIKFGSATYWQEYFKASAREAVAFANVNLTIAPNPVGRQQTVGSAKGGIIEDTWGTPHGFSRGVKVCEATTNKATSPIFGHGTWFTGWTAGAECTVTQNTDKEYVLFGDNSAYCVPTGATTNHIYQAIAVGNTNQHVISYYVKRPDGGAVTSAHAELSYNGALTETYTNLGNGFWRIDAAKAGVAASTAVYLSLAVPMYVCGMQIEENATAYSTPLCHGDMLGCTPAGVVHESTTTRAAGQIRWPVADIINQGAFTVVMAIKWRNDDDLGNNAYLWSNDNTKLRAYIHTDDTIVLHDGTNDAVSTALTYSENTITVFHFTVAVGAGLKIYVNGAVNGTDATYSPAALGTYFYLGSGSDVGNQGSYTIHEFRSYNRELTAAEILADYTDISERLSGGDSLGQRVNSVPWFWTKDGDLVLDNATAGALANYGVIGGVPGDVEAETEWLTTVATPGVTTYWLGVNGTDMDKFRRVSDYYFIDKGGSADANAAGGEYLDYSMMIPATLVAGFDSPAVYDPDGYNGTLYYFIRLAADTGTPSVQIQTYLSLGASDRYGDLRTIGLSTSWELFFVGQDSIFVSKPHALKNYVLFSVYVTATTEFSLEVDYVFVFPGRLLKITKFASETMTGFLVRGKDVQSIASGALVSKMSTSGDELLLKPNSYNYVFAVIGRDDAANTLTDTITMTTTTVRPRYKTA